MDASFRFDELIRAIQDAKSETAFINVLASNSGILEPHELNYHGESAYPHLERIPSVPDYLDEILKPLVSSASATH